MRKWRGFADNGACPVDPTGGRPAGGEAKPANNGIRPFAPWIKPWSGRADVRVCVFAKKLDYIPKKNSNFWIIIHKISIFAKPKHKVYDTPCIKRSH